MRDHSRAHNMYDNMWGEPRMTMHDNEVRRETCMVEPWGHRVGPWDRRRPSSGVAAWAMESTQTKGSTQAVRSAKSVGACAGHGVNTRQGIGGDRRTGADKAKPWSRLRPWVGTDIGVIAEHKSGADRVCECSRTLAVRAHGADLA